MVTDGLQGMPPQACQFEQTMEVHSARCAMQFREETSATEALLVRSSDALAASTSSQKLPRTICNENFHDLLKVAHSKRHCQNPVNMHLRPPAECSSCCKRAPVLTACILDMPSAATSVQCALHNCYDLTADMMPQPAPQALCQHDGQ